MNINIVKLHELVDEWYQEQLKANEPSIETVSAEIVPEEPKRELPEGKRAVRTKSQGDKVFYLDEEKKTRQWVTNPDVLDSLGFKIEDVTEIDDMELMRYQLSSAVYKPVNGPA
jgi:hypothetical protein